MRNKGLEPFSNLVDAFGALPGIGEKSALKLAYHIATGGAYDGIKLSHAIEQAVESIQRCSRCNNLSQDELCDICSDELRESSKVCIVESAKDILTIEKLGQYNGRYYVLSDIDTFDLVHLREALKDARELIFAFAPSIASDTMMLYIESQLEDLSLTFTKIAQGVPTGISLESVDTLSLARAIEDRVTL
ncbi:MAG TPA: recombination protein RecR [Nitratifractor sp.]|nr:recombination protein RecR [Nitratifractor sp.]HHH20643.1 recombination protein RecR [Nitratifractor sp.]